MQQIMCLGIYVHILLKTESMKVRERKDWCIERVGEGKVREANVAIIF